MPRRGARRKRTGRNLTPIEAMNLLKFINETFTSDFWEHAGFNPTEEGVRMLWDEYCGDLSYGECIQQLTKQFSIYIKPEVREERMIKSYIDASVNNVLQEVTDELLKRYGTIKISELYKKDKVVVTEQTCEPIYRRINEEYEFEREECREEKYEEVIDWNSLFIEKTHPLYVYIKEKFSCVDLYEMNMVVFRLQAEKTESDIIRFTEQFAREEGFKPASIPEIHLRAPWSLLWIVTLKDTYLDDKILVCEYGTAMTPVTVDTMTEIMETAVVYPLTHKAQHLIGVFAWILHEEKGRMPGYYAYIY
jgi:hypothetical protein